MYTLILHTKEKQFCENHRKLHGSLYATFTEIFNATFYKKFNYDKISNAKITNNFMIFTLLFLEMFP